MANATRGGWGWLAVIVGAGFAPAPLAGQADVVLVALSGRDSVALFDGETLERLGGLPVGTGPHEIAPAPDRSRAFVADAGDSTISVVALAPAPRIEATWSLPRGAGVHDLAVESDGARVWGVVAPRQQALALDARTGALLRTVDLGRAGGWMVESGGPGGAIVVAHLEGGAVTLVDPVSGERRVLPARVGEIDAAPSPDGREIWSVNLNEDEVTVHDADAGTVSARLAAGARPVRVVFAPDGSTAYVVAASDSALVAFDVRTRERRASAAVPGGPKVLALSPDGRRGYLTHPAPGGLTMVDLASMRVLRSVPLAGAPDGVAVLSTAPPPGSTTPGVAPPAPGRRPRR